MTLTMSVITISAFLSEGYVDSFERMKTASYAVLFGVIVSLLLAILTGQTLFQRRSIAESILGYGFSFTGGMVVKNYFAAEMITVFIGYYYYNRYVNRKSGTIILVICVISILLANSRGAIVMLIVFLIAANADKIKHIKKNQRIILIVTAVLFGIVVAVKAYETIVLNSETYFMRVQGLLNYIEASRNDRKRLLFGASADLYDQKYTFGQQFKSIFGYNGSMEISWLSVLAKNGILGIVGYAIIFIREIRGALTAKLWKYKEACLSIIAMFLVSSLVEDYLVTIHTPVGIYCYLAIGGLVGLCKREE